MFEWPEKYSVKTLIIQLIKLSTLESLWHLYPSRFTLNSSDTYTKTSVCDIYVSRLVYSISSKTMFINVWHIYLLSLIKISFWIETRILQMIIFPRVISNLNLTNPYIRTTAIYIQLTFIVTIKPWWKEFFVNQA